MRLRVAWMVIEGGGGEDEVCEPMSLLLARQLRRAGEYCGRGRVEVCVAEVGGEACGGVENDDEQPDRARMTPLQLAGPGPVQASRRLDRDHHV